MARIQEIYIHPEPIQDNGSQQVFLSNENKYYQVYGFMNLEEKEIPRTWIRVKAIQTTIKNRTALIFVECPSEKKSLNK